MDNKMVKELKIEGYEEITKQEFMTLRNDGEIAIRIYDEGCGDINEKWFKPVQKFPVVFENNFKRIEVAQYGHILVRSKDKMPRKNMGFIDSIEILEDAMKLSKKLRGKK